MAIEPRSLSLIKIIRTGDKETKEVLEIYSPSVTSFAPTKPVYMDSWAEPRLPGWRSGRRTGTIDICITGNMGLYEKLDKMIADCYAPVGPFYTPPPAPSQHATISMLAGLLAASLLALVLLASGLG